MRTGYRMLHCTSIASYVVFTALALGLVGGSMTKEQLVKNIAKELEVVANKDGKLTFNMNDIRWMFKKLQFKNCTNPLEASSTCNLCIKPEEVMSWFGHTATSTLSEKDVMEMSTGIIYILGEYERKQDGTMCESFVKTMLGHRVFELYNMYSSKYGNIRHYGILDESSIAKLVANVNKTLEYQLTGKKCLTTQSIVKGVNLSTNTIERDDLSHVTSFILMKLINKGCLERKLPGQLTVLKTMLKIFEGIYSELFINKLSMDDGSLPNNTKCYTRKDIKDKLSLNNGSIISERKFYQVSPAFTRVLESENICDSGDTSIQKRRGKGSHQRKPTWEPWVGSFISISIISFGSLIGILAFSTKKRKYFHHVLSFLVSLGSSVLLCDSVLHLIPHALGFHGTGGETSNHFAPSSYLWKCFMVLIGVYLFIMMELILSVFGFDHGHSHIQPHDGIKVAENDKLLEMTTTKHHVNDNSLEQTKTVFTVRSIKSVAWMILIGDAVHNFMDGVAIGGVFSDAFPAGLQGGIMTSIAILIHEVPHELGDFAVLISSGLTIKRALVLNLLSSLTAFIGGIVGIILGTNWNAAPWIYSLMGGIFIYISLVDMLPEVRRSPLLKTSPKLTLLLDFCGFAVGLLIMFFLAGYEEQLEKALG